MVLLFSTFSTPNRKIASFTYLSNSSKVRAQLLVVGLEWVVWKTVICQKGGVYPHHSGKKYLTILNSRPKLENSMLLQFNLLHLLCIFEEIQIFIQIF